MTTITKKVLTIHVSGNFLTGNYPPEYDKLSEKDLFRFIEDNAWEQFEYMEPRYVFDLISDATFALAEFLKEQGVVVK